MARDLKLKKERDVRWKIQQILVDIGAYSGCECDQCMLDGGYAYTDEDDITEAEDKLTALFLEE